MKRSKPTSKPTGSSKGATAGSTQPSSSTPGQGSRDANPMKNKTQSKDVFVKKL